jgi:SAM-dependent methyltransferase
MQLLSGPLYGAILCAAAELRVAEALEAPRSLAELASVCGAGEEGLGRLLRALAVLGLVERRPDGRWGGTGALAFLGEDHPASLRALALLQGEPAILGAWQRCAEAVRTGRPGFELSNGMKIFEFLDSEPRLRRLFQRSVSGSPGWNQAVVEALDLSGRGVLVDVGAGEGGLLRALLARWPALEGVALDRPGVVAAAQAQGGKEERLSWVAGDFFSAIPDGDVQLLRWVLHDWPDEEAAAILGRCRAALRPGGVLYLVENLIDQDPGAALLDLSMLILTGGRERSQAEYATLLAHAGLRLERVIPTRAGVKILEATASPAPA